MALFAIAAAMAFANAPGLRRAGLYCAGVWAFERQDLSQSLIRFHRLYQLDPQYRDVEERLERAASRLADSAPGRLEPEAEIALLRWLARTHQEDRLAGRLDRNMAFVPAGEFLLGSDAGEADERPQRRITLDAYEIDRFETTNAQYRRFVIATGAQAPRHWTGTGYPEGAADHPVLGVSWEAAAGYCAWAGKRLPTEAEWEKACRGTEGRIYPWGAGWRPERANTGLDTAERWPLSVEAGSALLQAPASGGEVPAPRAVGSYPGGASPYGVYDLCGNASEWVQDWYNWEGNADLPDHNPVGEGPPWNRVLRGSAWFDLRGRDELVADTSRCSARNSSHAYADPRAGFRCARSFVP